MQPLSLIRKYQFNLTQLKRYWGVGRWSRHLLEDSPKLDLKTKNRSTSSFLNCTPPAIEEFPSPGISQYVRARGGLIIHLMVSIYMFVALSIVCDDYFVPALEIMVECKCRQHLQSEDNSKITKKKTLNVKKCGYPLVFSERNSSML